MVGWDVSRHPEWDMMYAAGLTVREISTWCHQTYSTVHLHLQVREKYSPGLRARHEAALADRGPSIPSTKWRNRLTAVVDFYQAHGRMPAANDELVEQSMHLWLCSQRCAFERGDMPLSKKVLLEASPGWDQNSHQQQLDQLWNSHLQAFLDFVDTRGQMPRYRNYSSEFEHQLGVWMHNQHQRRSQGNLVAWRLEALNAAAPDWRSQA